jgi:uncharacterized protein (TIGR03437 family)
LINGCSKEFSMSTYLVLLKHPLRTLFWCLVLGGALFLWLHPGAHSSAQNLAPELATGKLNTPREGHSATLLQNGKVLVAGGRNGGEVTNTAELYDPATGQWTPTANTLAQARHGHSAVLLRSGQVLVIGGQGANNSYLNSAEIYDPADNSWKSALGSQMNVARHHATATLLNTGRVLVVGGVNSAGVQRSAEIYNPVTLKWTRTDVNNAAGNLSEARAEHTATLLTDGRVLVAGGIGSAGAALRSTELYEPGANRWRRVGDLLTQRASHTATLLPDGTVLAAGGANGATAHSSAELFTPATGAWMATGALAPRFAHTATLLPNGRVVVAGGKADATRSLSSVQVYNYLDKKWSDAPQAPPFANQAFALLEARSAHTATLLTNGQLLFVGGRPGSDAALNSAELYEFATAHWLLTKNAAGTATTLNTARAAHTATLLPNGKVLVAGGYTQSGSTLPPLESAELYDPQTGGWIATNPLNQARAGHTATLLPNGKVLVVGGAAAGQPLDTAELYDPNTGFWTLLPGVTPRFNHTATLLQNGTVLIAGGITTGNARTTSVQIYDPFAGANGAWSNTQSLLPGRSSHTATLLPSGAVFVFGGLSSSSAALNTGALFTPAGTGGTWSTLTFVESTTSQVPAYRYGHTATLLPSGKVLMAGGRGGTLAQDVGKVIGHAELYVSSTRSFERGRATTASRFDHTATLLPNGRVLLFGGRTIGSPVNNCSEPSANPPVQLFDPFVPLGSATSVVQVADPLQLRDTHTATLLATGQVLIAGGENASVPPNCAHTPVKHAELYDNGLGYQESWRPRLSYLTATANNLTVNGVQFQGISEATGHGSQSSSSGYPVARLQSLDNEQQTVIPLNPTFGWTNNTFSFTPLSGFPAGPALLTIYVNGIPSQGRVVSGTGGDLTIPNASVLGSIQGRVILHNGTGIEATVTLAPAVNSPTGCSPRQTLAVGPNGEFNFNNLIVRPTPSPSPPAPQVSCDAPNPRCTQSFPDGCTVDYTVPTATPSGTAVTCTPPPGSRLSLGFTTVTCTARNASGEDACAFQIVISRITCPGDVTVNTTGNSAVVQYSAPSVQPTNFTASCQPPSGSTFPVGVTPVLCRVNQNPNNTCGFNVRVNRFVGATGTVASSAPPNLSQTAVANLSFALLPRPERSATNANALEPQQSSTCRYEVAPSATRGGTVINFFPARATFTMTSGIAAATSLLTRTPEQSGPTCLNCLNNVFVSTGPTYNLAGDVRRRDNNAPVSDVALEFSVPYAIYDDRLTCQDMAGNAVLCTAPNAFAVIPGTSEKIVCKQAVSQTNLAVADGEFFCACTQLSEDGESCAKTVLGRASPASGQFVIANVPNGANAVITPGNLPSGTQYTFGYQPPAPPGVPEQEFAHFDQVSMGLSGILFRAQTACTPGTPPLSAPGGSTVLCAGSSLRLQTGSGSSFAWYRDGTATPFQTTAVNFIDVTQTGSYRVRVTDANGCQSDFSAALVVTANQFMLGSTSAAFGAQGGTGSVNVTSLSNACPLSVSSNAAWLTVTSSPANGGGTVSFSVAANLGFARNGTLTIADKSFNVTQAGAAPRLDALNPASANVGTPGLTLTLTGANFTATAKVRWNGSERPTSFTSATQLSAQLAAADLATAGTFNLDVFDPPPAGGGTSNALNFTVQPAAAVTLAALDPEQVLAGSPAFTLTVHGANFINGATVRIEGQERTTAFVSATRLTAQIPASDVAAAGARRVTVALPGGAVSNELTLQVSALAASVSAASFRQAFAPEAILAGFGTNLATTTQVAMSLPLPTTLAGTTVRVRDSLGVTREAPLFFVSPNQVNYLLPAGMASGLARVTFTVNNSAVAGEEILVTNTAPGLFSANATGQGLPAALVIRLSGGVQSTVALSADGIDLGPSGDQVFLILFGTGLRYRPNLASVTAMLGGTALPISFAAAQGNLAGLDQVNLGPLPASLRGRGELDLVLTVEGRTANTLKVRMQ